MMHLSPLLFLFIMRKNLRLKDKLRIVLNQNNTSFYYPPLLFIIILIISHIVYICIPCFLKGWPILFKANMHFHPFTHLGI